ncbi:MYND-type domain-containing protein [Mycena venus]|uniref:MYND-type domain-containing protein n=1 Tax=Mycena venus TaxID=2733690 RepID=A0A8H7CKZ7_9AGAR|nr:MYND-type domain-containing protein [Mycena venus]
MPTKTHELGGVVKRSNPSCLDIRNTSKLRPEIRRCALSAVDGSFEDLCKLNRFIFNQKFPSEEALFCLPVIYSLLDPSSIPDGDTLDRIIAIGANTLPVICADASLKGLHGILVVSSIPRDALPDLWLHVWPWLQFLHEFREYLPGFADSAELPLAYLPPILLSFRYNVETDRILSATSGVVNVWTHVWIAMLNSDGPGRPEQVIHALRAVSRDALVPTKFQEILDAVGDDYHDLACAVHKQISYALAQPESDTKAEMLFAILDFLNQTNAHDPFPTVLLSQGILVPLLTALETLTASSTWTRFTTDAILYGIQVLAGYLMNGSVCPWVGHALDAGLLRFIISCALKSMALPPTDREDMTGQLKWLVHSFLPLNLVSYPVMTAMKRSFPDAQRASCDPKFAKSPLAPHWNMLIKLVEERVVLLDAWEAAGSPSLRACANKMCRKIRAKEEFKCCARCRTAYCSSECQRADWRADHRESCKLGRNPLNHPFEWLFRRRERAFIRLLLDADYKRMKLQISRDIVLFMRAHAHTDAPDAFQVLFDYKRPEGVKAIVVSRSDDSAGRYRGTRLHAVLLALGTPQPHLFPLHTSSPVFEDGLCRIASEIPLGANALSYTAFVEAKVQALMQATEDVVEIH